jgi:elongation factor P hydroxylase
MVLEINNLISIFIQVLSRESIEKIAKSNEPIYLEFGEKNNYNSIELNF